MSTAVEQSAAAGPALAANIPLIDHHCHGLAPHAVERAVFETMISESFVAAPNGTTHFDAPVGLSMRAVCPPLLDLEPFCSPEDYMARRTELGGPEVNKRFLQAAGLERMLIDTGFRGDDIMTPPQMEDVSGIPAHEVVRIEAVAEEVARRGTTGASFAADFAAELESRCREAVGLKSILGYRGGFAIDPAAPTAEEVVRAAGAWLARSEASGRPRMDDRVLLRHGLWVGAELARARGLPIQFHVGFGDRDLRMHLNDPSLLSDYLQAMDDIGVDILLLHCYPHHRTAGYLSEVFPNVYFDIGVVMNYTGAMSGRILEEALELAPFTKQLYSSDAFGVAEFYYMQSRLFRQHLARILDDWIARGHCNAPEAERIVRMIATDNVRRIYPAFDRDAS
jgi:hypothetical protein